MSILPVLPIRPGASIPMGTPWSPIRSSFFTPQRTMPACPGCGGALTPVLRFFSRGRLWEFHWCETCQPTQANEGGRWRLHRSKPRLSQSRVQDPRACVCDEAASGPSCLGGPAPLGLSSPLCEACQRPMDCLAQLASEPPLAWPGGGRAILWACQDHTDQVSFAILSPDALPANDFLA